MTNVFSSCRYLLSTHTPMRLSLAVNCRQLSRSRLQCAEQTIPPASSVGGEPPKGKVYASKPVRMQLEADTTYGWCTCGYSKKPPLCDGAHKAVNQALSDGDPSKPVTFRSHKFQVDESKEYLLCNCRQTDCRPFCDGTHKQQWVQDAVAGHAE